MHRIALIHYNVDCTGPRLNATALSGRHPERSEGSPGRGTVGRSDDGFWAAPLGQGPTYDCLSIGQNELSIK